MPRPPDVTDDELVDAIRSATEPVLTTAEISDRVGLGARGLRDRLARLVEDGRLVTKKVGGTRIYYPPELQDVAGQLRAGSPEDTRAADARQAAAALVEGLELKGSGDVLQERHEAILMAVELIARRGSARRADILDELFPEHSVGYGTPRSLWENSLLPGLQQLAAQLDELGVESQTWRWRPDFSTD